MPQIWSTFACKLGESIISYRRKPPVTLLGLVRWPVGGAVCRGLLVVVLLRVFNFLIFKWVKNGEERERVEGGVAALRDSGLLLAVAG